MEKLVSFKASKILNKHCSVICKHEVFLGDVRERAMENAFGNCQVFFFQKFFKEEVKNMVNNHVFGGGRGAALSTAFGDLNVLSQKSPYVDVGCRIMRKAEDNVN